MKNKIIYLLVLCIAFLLFGASFAKKQQEDNTKYLNIAFWEKFNDGVLLKNILTGYNNNLDLKIAALKVKESEKIVKLSLAQELPTIDFDPMIGRVFSSGDLRRGSNNYMIKSYRQSQFLLPVEVSYEVDIWGKNRLKTKSKNQSLKIVKQDEKIAYIVLTSAIATNYYNLIKIDKLLELEKNMLDLSIELENLLKNKKSSGLASTDEVLSAQQTTVQIEQNINVLKSQKEIIENQIAYLLGDKLLSKVERKSFSDVLELNKVPQSLSSEIIQNRPDVISASENIIRAKYDARIAKKELLPTFTITGTFGFNGYNNLAGIFKNHTGIAQIFVLPNWNIFDGGKRYNMIKLKKFELERANKEYEKVIISSIQEVNDNLASLKEENQNYKLSKRISNIQDTKLKLKQNNMNYGLANKLEYILYKQANILAQEQYVDKKINSIIAYINLYKACGGVDFNNSL